MSVKAVGWARSFPVAQGVKAGRDWAREHLAVLGWSERAPETADDVLLAVSELITNAHVHAHSDAHVVLVWDGRYLRVSVGDSSAEMPAALLPDPERPSGRGMALIDALADDWEARRRPDGKTVTAAFSFELPGRRD
ncbi:ATP-binding protein [Actinacidiphila sp. ITFR-21]|uniref:ATP-binding protein n=1 Tax=Actinacidiphila sp. ITFR-21 TaxID=3075199 RepID=UPI0028899FC9|nr:ATP-binding protein [Streptomyces sp. ITFR-21]WNI14460.1 ATP-binding protein [Streptomyces sp. ITFR-21]